MKYTLSEKINNFIDNFLIMIGFAKPSIKTNGQVWKLIQTEGVDVNDEISVNNFIGNISQGPAIWEAKAEIKEYLKAVQVGDRAKSDELRENIEAIIAGSPYNRGNITFCDMINSRLNRVDSYSQYIETMRYIQSKAIFLEMAKMQGRITPDTAYFIQMLPWVMTREDPEIRRYVSSIRPEAYKIDIEGFIEKIKKSEGNNICELPDSLKHLKEKIDQYYREGRTENENHDENLDNSEREQADNRENRESNESTEVENNEDLEREHADSSENLENNENIDVENNKDTEFENNENIESEVDESDFPCEKYSINPMVLKKMKASYPKYKDLSDRQFLAALGKQCEIGEELKVDEIRMIKNIEAEDLQVFYGKEISTAAETLKIVIEKRNRKMLKKKYVAAEKALQNSDQQAAEVIERATNHNITNETTDERTAIEADVIDVEADVIEEENEK